VVAVELTASAEVSREHYVLNGFSNPLETGVAELSGCQSGKVHWMEKFGDWKHAECLSGWSGTNSSAAWPFRTLAPGAFFLDVEYSCPAADDYSEWRVRCGDTTLTFPLIDTGERAKRAAFGGELPRFRTYRVGIIDLTKPGAQRLTISPTGQAGGGIRISALSLTPVE
jgi:alpha-L-fucosidase